MENSKEKELTDKIMNKLFPDQKPMREFSTGARRDNAEGKGRFDLIEPCMLVRLAKRCEFGAIKYGDNNWKKGIPDSSLWDSAFRHFVQAKMGLKTEDHLAACAWNLMALMYNEENRTKGAIDENN